MKAFKKAIALVLCLVMTVGIFAVSGITVDDIANLFPKAEAAITLGGITQQRVVSNYESLYRSYQKRFFNGEETNWPTNFVIPGLGDNDDFTPQGMTYWKAKEWILISAYDAGGSDPSVIYALDVVSTDLVAVFKMQNADGSTNLSHGGGIAASEYNFYYADSGSKISYVPLSEMDVAPGTTKTIKLKDSIDLNKELNGVATSYCCYDEGVLWTGNFYISSDDRYNKEFASDYKQTLMGYKLAGNSSAEEWYYLKNGYNLVKLNSDSPTNNITSGAVTYRSYNVDGANAEIRGTVTTDTALGEVTPTFASVSLTEGKKYKIEFIADNNLSDMYMFAPNGGHCNVKQSQASKVTNLGNGKYHYQMIFTAGLKPTGADSSWPTTQSTNGTYTGTYTIRFDQDNIPAGGRSFNITDFSISEYVEPQGFTPNSKFEGIGCQGNPTYVILLNMDKIQYAMVDKGKIYISRSWSRSHSTNHSRDLVIGDIDLTMPGNENRTINGRTRPVHIIKYADCTHFGGDSSSSTLNQMLYMGEALCVIDDYLYMFGESAAYTYRAKEDNKCPEPIDVIWKIDQYAIQGLTRPHEDVASVEYQKVNSLSELNGYDEYIVLYESAIKDPVTQRNILYLLDSNGGYGDTKLPKKASASGITAANTGDTRGIVGYEIRDYSVDGTKLILNAEDDAHKSLHWQFESGASTSLRLKNRELYFAKNPYLYVGDSLFAMTTTASSTMTIKDWGNGEFTIYGSGEYYSIWCNDGSVPASVTAYTNFYSSHGQSGFAPNYHNLEEIPGTFHITNNGQPALPTNEQQALHIYKRISDPYASSYETQVYTDLQAKLTADGTYNITLETYATNALQYQRVDQRPTDFVFVVDVSGSMDQQDAYGYNTSSDWSPLKMSQACGDVSNSFFSRGSNYNTAHSGNFWFRFPDGEFGQIHVAFNERGSSSAYARDLWLWAEHPVTKRCYRLSKFGFMTKGNFNGGADWDQDSAARITDADFLANHLTLGWANEAAVMVDVNADRYMTDYHGTSYNSTGERAGYELMHHHYSDAGVTASYYTHGACQRILGVKQAMDKLAVKIQQEATRSGLDHRIAIVTSGSDGTYVSDGRPWANTGILTNSGTWKNYTGGTSLSTADYQSVFFSAKNSDNISTIRNYITNQLPCYGHSPINQGLTLASNIINAQKSAGTTYDVNGNRSAVVVVISDGAAGGDNDDYRNATNANNCANDAIGNGGLSLKKNGAYIFTVQIGSQDYVSGFEETDFMKYLSSKYTGSTSMTDPGPLNTKENNYYINVPVGSSFNIDTITNSIFNGVIANSNNAIASLNSSSVLREHLTDAFDLTNATITYKTATSRYDGIGRLYFDAPQTTSGVTATIDKNTNNIEVTGFDYTAKNVSEYNSKNGNGAKLIIEITGVIADADAELLNTSINDTSKTALYQNRSYMSDTLANDKPVKRFPTYHFSIPEYTYYMDYDIPMYDSDINGTLCSVDSTLQKQSTYKTSLSTGNMGIQFVNGNQDMVYTLNSQAGLTEKLSKGYVLIKRDDGSYDWFRLNIVPASTVYYEENKMDVLDGTQSFPEWTQNGSFDGKYQTLSSNSDVFGFDSTYCNSKDNFSLGTHKVATVTSSDKRSDTQTFTFTGIGFDIISACGTNTGLQTVTVKKEVDGAQKIVKVFMIDTYYNDSTYGTVYQVPIVQFKGDYGTYTVETTATYVSFAGALKHPTVSTNAIDGTEITSSSAAADSVETDEIFAQLGMDELIGQDVEFIWMDDNSVLNGGTGVEGSTLSTQAGENAVTSLTNYIDGFRIYNPQDYNDEYIASEKNATFYSVIDAITAGSMGGDNFVGYLEGGATGSVFADYLTSGGPKYEVYLKPDASIAFRFKATDFKNDYPRAMVSVRAASGSPKAKFVNTNDLTHAYETDVLSGSETYYDITDSFILTVTNTGSGLLAVDNLKLVNATLVPLSGVSVAELNEIISTQAVEFNPFEKKAETFTFVQAPADDPNIDPEGSIPTVITPSDSNAGTVEENPAIGFLKEIISKIVDFFKMLIGYIKNLIPIM